LIDVNMSIREKSITALIGFVRLRQIDPPALPQPDE